MDLTKKDDIIERSAVKILAVDDREDNLLSIETILDHENYTIIKAGSGRAALKILLQQQDFTLILMDVQMPDMNGFETASLIYEREKLRHIPIIFITAHNQGEERMFEGYKMGGVDFIYKPINPELLRYKVSVFAELYQKTHQLLSQERKLLFSNKKLETEIEERRISEEKVRLLNEQLLENNQQLKATIEELDRFAYVASHDLQEPLRKILVFSDKIQTKYREGLSEEMYRNLDKIVKSSERMQMLINDLLRFSRETSTHEDFALIPLTNLLQDVVADMEVEIERNAALVEISGLPQVWGIPSLVRQLFQNLISNAIKFRQAERIPLVRIYEESQKPERLRLVVEDNGIGFESQYAEEIFMVFKRLHSYHDFAGSGVGLSICKKIIEKHNGTIVAESELGRGSRFIIDLPKMDLDTPTKSGSTADVRARAM